MSSDIPSAFNRVSRSIADGSGGSHWSTVNSGSSGLVTLNLAPPPAAVAAAAAGRASTASSMKIPVKPPPLKSLPPLSCYGASSGVPVSPLAMDRLPLPLSLPFSPDLLWRYPLSGLSSSSSGQPPSSPLLDVKQQLPGALGPDPRTWAREDVVTFLRWCEREFDLPGLDLDKFQMNGKALCLLNKSDIAERAPGSGDVVHNALQLLLRDAPYGGRVPSSPLTPHGPGSLSSLHSQQQHALSHALAAAAAHQNAQNHAAAAAAAAAASGNGSSSGGGSGSGSGSNSSHLLSPPNSARTPTSASWPSAGPLFASAADFHNLGHLIQQTNSVTLSPAPSMDGNSQGGSPSHAEQSAATASAATAAAAALAAQAHLSFYTHALQAHSQQQSAAAAASCSNGNGSHSGSGSQSQSDSESESLHDSSPQRSPAPSTPSHHHSLPPPLSLQSLSGLTLPAPPMSPVTLSSKDGGSAGSSPGDGLDSGSNGRLLWDFLQQLLNDPSQRYSHYIAWKNRETGVFKITDPAGLARLWGIQKNHPSMNYDKMSRALRYYYRVNILRKVQGERHCYQFLRNPVELKSIKNISLLRHQMAAAAAAAAGSTTPSPSAASINNNNNNNNNSSSSSSSNSKVADSTDASSERYSPSSTADEYQHHHHHHHYDDCEMPTDLSMDRMAPPYLSTIKTEKLAS